MIDISKTTAPKTDQLNYDDVPNRNSITIKVTKVTGCADPSQPIAIHFEGDSGKPYKPCKSMRRVMVHVWGSDGANYVGRSMTLYGDPTVMFGGIAVGGIRISHMSEIDKDVTMALTASKASRKPYTVKPLAVAKAAAVNPLQSEAAAFAKEIEAANNVTDLEMLEERFGDLCMRLAKSGGQRLETRLHEVMEAQMKKIADGGDTITIA